MTTGRSMIHFSLAIGFVLLQPFAADAACVGAHAPSASAQATRWNEEGNYDGVRAYWREGPVGVGDDKDWWQYFKFVNGNDHLVKISYRAIVTCAEGNVVQTGETFDTMKPGETSKSSAHWTTACVGGGHRGRARSVKFSIEVSAPEKEARTRCEKSAGRWEDGGKCVCYLPTMTFSSEEGRCVVRRKELLCGRYAVEDEGNGIEHSGTGLVRDTRTNLRWQRFRSPSDDIQAEAQAYCAGKGMRLPTRDEALAIGGDSYCEAAWPEGWDTWTSTFVNGRMAVYVLERSGAKLAFGDRDHYRALCVR